MYPVLQGDDVGGASGWLTFSHEANLSVGAVGTIILKQLRFPQFSTRLT